MQLTASGMDLGPLLQLVGWVVVALVAILLSVSLYFFPRIRGKFKEAQEAREREEREGREREDLSRLVAKARSHPAPQ